MKVASCLIARLENKYIAEYIQYYKNLGVDKIFIYDNNEENEDNIHDETQPFEDEGFVEIIPFSHIEGNAQKQAYKLCYDTHKDEYDWISFFDCDEYIILNEWDNIKDMLSDPSFESYSGVAVANKNYTTSQMLVNDTKNRVFIYNDDGIGGKYSMWSFYKCIIRGGLNSVEFMHPDIDGTHLPVIDNIPMNGLRIVDDIDFPSNPPGGTPLFAFGPTSKAFIKHIPTGCIDDYMHMKARRGWPDTPNEGTPEFQLPYFSCYNKITDDIIRYWVEHQGILKGEK